MMDNTGLDHFQERLVDLLLQPLPPETVITRLKSDPALTAYHAYIDSFEPKMVAFASVLLKEWAKEGL